MDAATANPIIENRTYDEMALGDTASLTHTVTQRDIDLFAAVSGDLNPAHVDPDYAAGDMFHHIIVHGMWGAGLISAVLGTRLPGPGAIYLGQDLHFRRPVSVGDTITATVTLREMKPAKKDVVFDCLCTNQAGAAVITGTAFVRAPTEKVRRPRVTMPAVRVERHPGTEAILARARQGGPIPTAVVFPVDALSLAGAVDAAEAGLMTPILVGPEETIRATATAAGLDLSSCRWQAAAHAAAAAAAAVSLVHTGEAAMVMKGDLHTDVLMHPVLDSATGLKTGRQISHAYVLDVPDYPRPLIVTDAAIALRPELEEKAGIVQNAIDLALRIGIAVPRVAILAAVETLSARMPATLDAAALCKMADRGQIKGGVLDGPLAFDNAISEAAAAEKGIVSSVAGRADILVVPDLEAGNILVKQMIFLSGAEAGGIVLGAAVPIVLTSRADSRRTRLISAALGRLLAAPAENG
ncbi:MAG TPA: bifunctional enoyl-CoA hydratase/phosphate acetyltransferase [Acidisoma sp.]|uniref:bifunctional enoyl-CoA hydratase/phosphate acetyltransferase n=1 Tax=Acidisoma sp. TaxID=1872115 RepID=UPI002B6C6A6E|nr:bifunctional enoyl-CoA hydratase/phosphate acetyltransferase [Acidisoma sp.]HTI00346.1 bifunctional enoyl-CoA hydratase/phosphate acetyltransferase [Acidisoma sp.]